MNAKASQPRLALDAGASVTWNHISQGRGRGRHHRRTATTARQQSKSTIAGFVLCNRGHWVLKFLATVKTWRSPKKHLCRIRVGRCSPHIRMLQSAPRTFILPLSRGHSVIEAHAYRCTSIVRTAFRQWRDRADYLTVTLRSSKCFKGVEPHSTNLTKYGRAGRAERHGVNHGCAFILVKRSPIVSGIIRCWNHATPIVGSGAVLYSTIPVQTLETPDTVHAHELRPRPPLCASVRATASIFPTHLRLGIRERLSLAHRRDIRAVRFHFTLAGGAACIPVTRSAYCTLTSGYSIFQK